MNGLNNIEMKQKEVKSTKDNMKQTAQMTSSVEKASGNILTSGRFFEMTDPQSFRQSGLDSWCCSPSCG